MLITVYRLTRPGLELVNEYYRWHIDPDQGYYQSSQGRKTAVKKAHCPGCARHMSIASINETHQCPGILTDYPVKPKYNSRIQLDTWVMDAQLQEYINNAGHPVTVS